MWNSLIKHSNGQRFIKVPNTTTTITILRNSFSKKKITFLSELSVKPFKYYIQLIFSPTRMKEQN